MRIILPHNILLFIFFIFQGEILRGQKNCDCPLYNSLEKDIKTYIYSESHDNNEIKRLSSALVNSQNEICKAQGYEFLAEVFLNKKLVDSAEIYLKQATAFLNMNNCSEQIFYSNFLLNLKLFYQKQNYDEAINYGYKALNIAENSNNNEKQAEILAFISRIFRSMQQYDKAIEYSRRASPYIQQLTPSVQKAILLEILTQNYNTFFQIKINNLFVETQKTHSAEESINIVMGIAKKDSNLDTIRYFANDYKNLAQQFNHKPTLINAYRHLQKVEWTLDNNDMALRYIDSSLMYCVPGIDDYGFFVGYGDKADIYFKLKNSTLALQYADSCLFYAQKTGVPLSIANAFLTKSDIAEFSGNWKDAFYSLRNVKIIMDSVQNIERTKAVNELEKKYNQAKNEKTIKELDQERRIYLLLALAALLAIVTAIFYMRQQSLKHKQTILETEQRLNRARMNPHFFFNALTSLQSFALRENDGKTLASNLSKFSHIMRETLESTYKEYITIEQEMEFLNEYLEIQKIRFPKKFSYEIKAENDVEIDELLIPSMIIQPFVENSIEHGFAGLEDDGHVIVLFKKEKNEISIEISDNGKGLNTSLKQPNEHISRASQIIKDRIYLLNIKLKTKARFSIDNQEGGKGVQVKIYLPQIFENESVSH